MSGTRKLLPFARLYPTIEDVKAIPGTLQEGGRPFDTTHWSVVVLAAQSQLHQEARPALIDFCQAYRPPLYAFLRRQGCASSDAQDLTQGFFAHLLEHDTLHRVSRARGKLRIFLLGSLQHYLANEYDHAVGSSTCSCAPTRTVPSCRSVLQPPATNCACRRRLRPNWWAKSTHLANECVAIFLRHSDVADQHVRPLRLKRLDGLGRACGSLHRCTPIFQEALYQGTSIRFVICHQHLEP